MLETSQNQMILKILLKYPDVQTLLNGTSRDIPRLKCLSSKRILRMARHPTQELDNNNRVPPQKVVSRK